MRSVESPRLGLIVSLVSLIVNVCLNYVLIFGKFGFSALGVRGAAIATVIARIVECALVLFYVLVIDKKLKFKLSELLRTDKQLLRDFIRYGTPIVAGQLVWGANMLLSSAIIGRQNVEGVITAVSIANTMNNLAYVTMTGLSNAVGIITGKTIGEGHTENIRPYARTVQLIFITLGLITGGSMQLLKAPLISLYNISAAAISQATAFINVLSVTIIGTCYQAACLFGLVKSGGDISFVFKLDLFFVFVVVIPSAIVATILGLAPWVVFACLKCDQILKCFVAIVKVNKLNWIKNLTTKTANR